MSDYDQLCNDIESAAICARNGLIGKTEFIIYLKKKIIEFEDKEKRSD